MDYETSFAISSAGMSVERLRVEVAALNLANANTVADADATAFRARHVVPRAGAALAGPFPMLVGQRLSGPAASIEFSERPPRRVLEPGHPLADPSGFVSYPSVDPATEMLTLMSATRAYEANVAAMNAARTLAVKALEIGGAQ